MQLFPISQKCIVFPHMVRFFSGSFSVLFLSTISTKKPRTLLFDTEVRENLFATTRKPTVKIRGRFSFLGGNNEISRFQYHKP